MSELISVIVPVYNTELYLSRCLESLLAQTYENLELILIDDGSTDSSGVICDQYREKDTRIKVIHTINQGQSIARNIGICNAIGKLVFFMDSDDIVVKNTMQILHDAYCDHHADLVIGDFKRIDKNNHIVCTPWRNRDDYLEEKQIQMLFVAYLQEKHLNKILVDVWGKLFCMDIIRKNQLRFDENLKSYENILFVFQYLSFSKKIFYCHEILYSYYRNQDNIGSGYGAKVPLDFKKSFFFIKKYVEESMDEKFLMEIHWDGIFGNAFIKESIANIYLINHRISIIHFFDLFAKIKLVIYDEDVQNYLKFYCQTNSGDIIEIPNLIKIKSVIRTIVAFKCPKISWIVNIK